MEAKDLLSQENLSILSKIEPEYQCYYKWFLALTEYPHQTFHCEKLIENIFLWFTKLGVDTEKDEHGNIVVRIPANGMPADSPVVCIQTHTDMVWVGEYVNGKIGVELQQREGNKRVLVAPKSTLGADDGFGVALCLEIAEQQKKFVHGPMELILTSDEETGLVGCQKLPRKDAQGNIPIKPFNFKYLINCDALKGDKVYTGSSGGIMYNINIDLSFDSVSQGCTICKIEMSDYLSGHSGATIHRGQANPIKWAMHFLNYLKVDNIEYRIANLTGGHAINAIPPDCTLEFAFDTAQREKVEQIINSARTELISSFPHETSAKCVVTYRTCSPSDKLVTVSDSCEVTNVITALPHGLGRYHPIYSDTLESSINLAIVRFSDKLNIQLYSRSASDCEFMRWDFVMDSIMNMCHLKHEVKKQVAGYPWPPSENRLATITCECASKVFKREIGIGFLQVTIEPSTFNKLGYTADMIAVCPSIPLAHCIGEFMDIDEAMEWRSVILDVLTKLKD